MIGDSPDRASGRQHRAGIRGAATGSPGSSVPGQWQAPQPECQWQARSPTGRGPRNVRRACQFFFGKHLYRLSYP
jgi:hypothetical protein